MILMMLIDSVIIIGIWLEDNRLSLIGKEAPLQPPESVKVALVVCCCNKPVSEKVLMVCGVLNSCVITSPLIAGNPKSSNPSLSF